MLILIADIPQELYSSYCNREVIDSVYTDCRQTAIQDYPDNADAGTDYLMADWAYGVSLLDLSEYCISNALDADVYDKILLADCLSMRKIEGKPCGCHQSIQRVRESMY